MDLFKGLRSYVGCKLRGRVFPKFLATPSGETMRRVRKKFWSCKNVLEVLYDNAKFSLARISPTAEAAKKVFCLFVRHAFERQRLCA